MTINRGTRMLRILPLAAVMVAASASFATVHASAAPAAAAVPIYSSLAGNLSSVGNLPSVGGEAYAFSEFGNEINTTSISHLGKVMVTLSTWGCQTGSWNGGNCSTTPGASFTEPITFNIYNSTGTQAPGSLIASVTKTFTIPYRPSANLTHCVGANLGKWWGGSPKQCFNGKAVNITFSFGLKNLPADVVYGIAYNTTHYGYNPIGESAPCFTSSGGCGYDSLNIALSQDPTNVTVGSDPNPGTVWQNSPFGSEYCDGGAAGTGTFREDSPTGPSCWGTVAPYNVAPYYIPAVAFNK